MQLFKGWLLLITRVWSIECSCDRRGTEVTRCPLDSPCFCDEETGQCPCRGGVIGPLCNECDDGYWNLDGDSGCQPCKCERDHSLNNTCDKVRSILIPRSVLVSNQASCECQFEKVFYDRFQFHYYVWQCVCTLMLYCTSECCIATTRINARDL